MKTTRALKSVPTPAAPQARPTDPGMLRDMPANYRARLLTLALHGLQDHSEGCALNDRDFGPILWLAQDLEFQVDDLVEREDAARAAAA